MSVILETSKGDIVVDLFCEDCPKACTNFLKLCKIKYYNNCLFYNVQRDFLVQTGDPTNTGRGGESVNGVLYGEQARCFEDEIRPHLKHKKRGVLGMASAGPDLNASQFYLTTGEALHSLDERHTIFGEVAEGWDVLEAINEAPCDDAGRPLQNIRIRHTLVIDDPFPDPPALADHIPDASPPPQFADDGRLEEDWAPGDEGRPREEVERLTREKEAKSRAVVLEMIGDLPEADAAPPSTMLFVCKLNPVTTEEDLEIIFGRFGAVTGCDIIRDWKTGDSLCYGFIGLDSERACEEAYFKMNNVLIDDRRIKVDFSQSVHHLWKQFRRFGRRGDAGLRAEAEEHHRGERGRGGAAALELKEHLWPGGNVKGGGGKEYSLLVEGAEGGRQAQGGGGALLQPPQQQRDQKLRPEVPLGGGREGLGQERAREERGSDARGGQRGGERERRHGQERRSEQRRRSCIAERRWRRSRSRSAERRERSRDERHGR